MPRVAVRRPARKRFCSGVGGGGGVGINSVTARVESGGVSGCCAPSEVAATQSNTARLRIKWSSIVVGRSPGYNVTMTVPATSRQTRTFEDRADALAHFFLRAGEAPRLIAYDDAVGCPLDQALAAIEWTSAVGILAQDDLIHAARLHLFRATHGRPPCRSVRGHAPVRRARRARLHLRAARPRDRALPARHP